MAIKVKHEGNVTSRIVASAAGGKGRRQAEDAIKLAQLQASATGRGGGGMGGGAHASAAAPTLHAPTGHAQLGSTGGFVSPQMSLRERMALEDQRQVNRLEELDATEDNRAAEQWRNAGLTEELHKSDFQRSEAAQLTAQGRREREALVNDVIAGVKAGRFSPEELPKLMEQFGVAEETIRMADALREHQPTAQEKFDQGIVYDKDGNRFYQKPNGDYAPLPNPLADAQAEEAKRQETERQKIEVEQQKAAQKRMDDRQKYINKALDAARAVEYGEEPPTTEELKAVIEKAGQEYDELFPAPQTPQSPQQPSAANAPQSAPPPTEDPNDPLAAFKKFRN